MKTNYIFTSLLFLSLISISITVNAQSYGFTEKHNLEFQDKDGNKLANATVGGFNQAAFLAIDVNNDGTKDVVVHDRSGRKTMPFIYEGGKLVYHPEYETAFPEFESWVNATDYNADDKNDLWFSKNNNIALYKNVTEAADKVVRFEKVSDELRGYNFNVGGIDTTSLYSMQFNQPAMQDVDLDGDIDVLTLQPFGYGITLFLNVTVEQGKPLDPPAFEEVDFCWGDFEEGLDNDTIILKRHKFCFSANYRYKKKHSGGSSLLLIDMDDDKDMDLVLGNAGFNNIIYLENGRKDFGRKCDTMTSYDLNWPKSKPARVDHFPASFYIDVDNDGLKDLVIASSLIDYSSGVTKEYDQIWFYKNEGTANLPNFVYKQSDFLVGEAVDYGAHTAPQLYDIDSDGDLDLFIATNGGYYETKDSSDRIVFLENIGNKDKAIFKEIDTDFLGLSSKKYNHLNISIGKLDSDTLIDLIVGKSDGTIDWYNILSSSNSYDRKEVEMNALNINVFETAAPCIVDVDKDGKMDMLVGCYGGNTYYYKNTGSSAVPNMTLETDTFGNVISNGFILTTSAETGEDTLVYDFIGYSQPNLVDIDGDGNREFVLGAYDGEIKAFTQVENNYDGTFQAIENLYYDGFKKACRNKDFGARSSLAIADINNDGRIDIIVGNNRGGVHYIEGVDSSCFVGLDKNINTIQNHFSVYPNPTMDMIYIETQLDVKIEGIELYDLKGTVVLTETKDVHEISLKDLPVGVYTLSIITEAGQLHKKIVKYH